jgi:biuret amidohydrolase
MELPSPGMTVDARRTALVITDLQNDFLSPGGIGWGLIAESLAENNTIENIESLLRAARRRGLPVFLSPHYYYPTDGAWVAPGGALEVLMKRMGLFARRGPLTLDGFAGSGADWPERFKPYIEDGETAVASPHKVYGTSSNDLVLQLRKRRVEKIIRDCLTRYSLGLTVVASIGPDRCATAPRSRNWATPSPAPGRGRRPSAARSGTPGSSSTAA